MRPFETVTCVSRKGTSDTKVAASAAIVTQTSSRLPRGSSTSAMRTISAPAVSTISGRM